MKCFKVFGQDFVIASKQAILLNQVVQHIKHITFRPTSTDRFWGLSKTSFKHYPNAKGLAFHCPQSPIWWNFLESLIGQRNLTYADRDVISAPRNAFKQTVAVSIFDHVGSQAFNLLPAAVKATENRESWHLNRFAFVERKVAGCFIYYSKWIVIRRVQVLH